MTSIGRAFGCVISLGGRSVRAGAVWFLLASLSACGGGGGGGADGPSPPPGGGIDGAPYFSYAVGDRWRSREGSTTTTTSVTRQEAAGLVLLEEGSDGYRSSYLLARSSSGVTLTPLPGGDTLTEAIGPYDIARFPLREGAAYRALDKSINGTLDLDGDGRADNFHVRIDVTVVGFGRVEVPAGSFDNALHQRTVITQTAVLSAGGRTVVVVGTADDWYAPGVGPVRSVMVIDSDGQRETIEEVLQDYRVGSLSNDTVAPTLLSRSPAEGSAGNNAVVQLVFSEAITFRTQPSPALVLRNAAGQTVEGLSQWLDARTLVFTRSNLGPFSEGTYTATLDGVPEDWSGNRLVGTVQWDFRVDASGPVLVGQTPLPGAAGVARDAVLSFTFDEELMSGAASTASVSLIGPDGLTVPVTVTVEGRVLRVSPQTPLGLEKTYTVTLRGVQDRLGNRVDTVDGGRFTTTDGNPGRFGFPERLPALGGRSVQQMRVADMNGDGRSDLLIHALNPGSTQPEPLLLLGREGGYFLDWAEPLLPNACPPTDLFPVDLDADGLMDILGSGFWCGGNWIHQIAPGIWRDKGGLGFNAELMRPIRLVGQVRPGILGLANYESTLVLLRPTGGAASTGFEVQQVLMNDVKTQARVLLTVDINQDGREDIVMADGRGGKILLGLQRADASFDMRTITVPDAEQVRLATDLTGDGRTDLLLSETSGVLVVLPQQPDGSYPATGTRYVLSAPVHHAQLADVDGDGRQEVLVSLKSQGGTVENLAVFAPRGAGTYTLLPLIQHPTLPQWPAPPANAPSVAVGEFTGDTVLDLLVLGELLRGREAVALPAGHRGARPGLLRSLPRPVAAAADARP